MRKFQKAIVVVICIIISILILRIAAFHIIQWSRTGRDVPKRFSSIDATIDEWRWLTNYKDIRTIVQIYYGDHARFPSKNKLTELIKEYDGPPFPADEDQWGNPVFYYNGREEGRCVWYASMGPDGLWFTGTKDPGTIIDRINQISVENEFNFISGYASKGFDDSQKYGYLVIQDDHVVFVNMSVYLFYSNPDYLIVPIEVFEEAQRRLAEIGTYENYKNLYGDQCIVQKFLESAIEDKRKSVGKDTAPLIDSFDLK